MRVPLETRRARRLIRWATGPSRQLIREAGGEDCALVIRIGETKPITP